MSVDVLNDVHQRMLQCLKEYDARIDDIFVCPHDIGECQCRKPQIGLFKQAEARYAIDKDDSYMIGDSATDIQAGKRYGVKTIAINKDDLGADYRFDSLYEAAEQITD